MYRVSMFTKRRVSRWAMILVMIFAFSVATQQKSHARPAGSGHPLVFVLWAEVNILVWEITEIIDATLDRKKAEAEFIEAAKKMGQTEEEARAELDAARSAGYFPAVYEGGDADLDGDVDFGDFLVLSNNYGSYTDLSDPIAAWSSGDFDLDGTVGFSDYLALSNNF